MSLSPCIYHCSCFEVIELLKQLSSENASTQKMLLEVRILLEDFIKSELRRRREVGYW